MEEEVEHLGKADSRLRAAKLLLENGFYEDAVSRAYYCMFHAARAALLRLGLSPKTHKGTVTLFSEEVVRRGLMPEKVSLRGRRELTLKIAEDIREKGECSPFFTTPKDAAEDLVEAAEKFLQQVCQYLERKP